MLNSIFWFIQYTILPHIILPIGNRIDQELTELDSNTVLSVTIIDLLPTKSVGACCQHIAILNIIQSL